MGAVPAGLTEIPRCGSFVFCSTFSIMMFVSPSGPMPFYSSATPVRKASVLSIKLQFLVCSTKIPIPAKRTHRVLM